MLIFSYLVSGMWEWLSWVVLSQIDFEDCSRDVSQGCQHLKAGVDLEDLIL